MAEKLIRLIKKTAILGKLGAEICTSGHYRV